MKVLLFGNAKLKYMPYINLYLENCDVQKNEVHIIYWNRDLQEETIAGLDNVQLHEFRLKQKDEASKLLKIKSYYKLRRYALNLIKREAFDFIVVLDALPGVLIVDYLKNKYKGKFIFDYRDSSYEKLPPFKKAIRTLAQSSCTTFVSSDGFRLFFPQNCTTKIHTTHNILLDSLNHRDDKKSYGTPCDKIRIAFWGIVRDKDLNRTIIKRLCNDQRFELHYYGKEENIASNLKAYTQQLQAENVFFHGEYMPEDRYKFIRSTDLIHNLYDNSNAMLAMGNKYYDGIIFRIPQLCMIKSFMGHAVSRSGVGEEFSPHDPDFAEKIFSYYKNINVDQFSKSCDKELQRVMDEYNEGGRIIRSYLS